MVGDRCGKKLISPLVTILLMLASERMQDMMDVTVGDIKTEMVNGNEGATLRDSTKSFVAVWTNLAGAYCDI